MNEEEEINYIEISTIIENRQAEAYKGFEYINEARKDSPWYWKNDNTSKYYPSFNGEERKFTRTYKMDVQISYRLHTKE